MVCLRIGDFLVPLVVVCAFDLLFVVLHSKELCKCPYRTVLLLKKAFKLVWAIYTCLVVMFHACHDNMKCYAPFYLLVRLALLRASSAFGSPLLWLLLDYSLMTEQSCLRRQRGKKGSLNVTLGILVYEHRSHNSLPFRVKCYPSLGILTLGTLLICWSPYIILCILWQVKRYLCIQKQ